MILTYRLRLKDKHAAELNRQARAVNFVFNYCNEMQQKAARAQRKWLTDVDLQRLTSGSGPLLDIHADTVGRICRQYVRSRKQHNRPWLRWRSTRSLGWVPFKGDRVRFDGEAFVFRKHRYFPMHLRAIPAVLLHEGSFSQDSRGRWYINVRVTVADGKAADRPSVGIDLGLKEVAVMSDGSRVANLQPYRALEAKYAMAKRANKAKLVRTVAAKIANVRADHLHKASAHIAKTYGHIFVGDVSSTKLARSRFAKSVLDASWGMFRKQLQYKSIANGGRCFEVNERMTSRTCSDCGAVSGPQGIAGLGIRLWTCGDCGATHDRDVNAARNIAARGLASLVEGTVLVRRSQVKHSERCSQPQIMEMLKSPVLPKDLENGEKT